MNLTVSYSFQNIESMKKQNVQNNLGGTEVSFNSSSRKQTANEKELPSLIRTVKKEALDDTDYKEHFDNEESDECNPGNNCIKSANHATSEKNSDLDEKTSDAMNRIKKGMKFRAMRNGLSGISSSKENCN